MKAYHTIKYLAFACAVSLWGCSNQQYAQNSEYDDLYFSSKDRKEVVYTASTSGNYAVGNTGEASQDNSQKNVNPEYVQQYADQNRNNNVSNTNGDDSYSADNNSYYDENYERQGNGVNLARDYNRNNSGMNVNIIPSVGFRGNYGRSAFYDPFYDPFYYGNAYYDPFFYRPFVRIRPGVIVSIGTGFGWGYGGWSRWNNWGWNDPYYSGYGSNGWGDPYYGSGYYNPYRYYGNHYYGGNYYGGNNVIIVNPGSNNDRRTVRYSPRTTRGSSVVNNNFDNSPRSGRAERGGRTDQSTGVNVNPDAGGRNANTPGISSEGRTIRPRGTTNEINQPERTAEEYNGRGSRTATPGNTGNDTYTAPRAVRPRGNSEASESRSNTYYDGSNRSSTPSYSTPSTGRSPRNSDYNSTPRNNSNSNSNNNSNSWNNSNSNSNNSRSNDSYRSSGSNNSNSNSGSNSAPAPSRGGDSGGGSRSPRSPR